MDVAKIFAVRPLLERGTASSIGRTTINVPTLQLSEVLGEIRGDDFMIVTARGGTGKTWLMLQMAVDMAVAGTPVAFFSGEMSVDDLAETRLMRMFEETRHLPKDAEPSKKLEAISRMKDTPLYFPDITSRWPFRSICTKVMDQMREKYGIKAFFFDHLRYFVNEEANDRNERAVVEQTVMDMRLYAKQHLTPIVLAVQPRQIHSDEEATIDTLKGSSALSQEATCVLVLDRPRRKKASERNRKTEDEDEVVYEPFVVLKVEKARHAQGNARLKLYLDYKTGRFVEWSKGGSELYAKYNSTRPLNYGKSTAG